MLEVQKGLHSGFSFVQSLPDGLFQGFRLRVEHDGGGRAWEHKLLVGETVGILVAEVDPRFRDDGDPVGLAIGLELHGYLVEVCRLAIVVGANH